MKEKSVLKKEEKEEILKILNNHEKIVREASLSWDGSNILLRLPKEIADYLKIDKKSCYNKNMKFTVEEINEGVKQTFEIVDRKKKNE